MYVACCSCTGVGLCDQRYISIHMYVYCIRFLFLQDRHIKKHGDGEPFVDPSQDYVLLLGYENATHTVMRFKRKLDTCDTSHDIPITVSEYVVNVAHSFRDR